MEYNTSKAGLRFREYGRYVENLIAKTKAEENPEKRQAFAERIVDVMAELEPTEGDPVVHRLKLWSHLVFLGGADLRVETPEGMVPYEEQAKPQQVAYPGKSTRHHYYGRYVQQVLDKVAGLPECPERDELISMIGGYMKLAYVTWNRDNVTDNIISHDIARYTDGRLQVTPAVDLDMILNPNKNSKQVRAVAALQPVSSLIATPKKKKKKKKKKKPGPGALIPSGKAGGPPHRHW
jgi:hypothetical protein